MEAIFENYGLYVNENEETLMAQNGAAKLLTDDVAFAEFSNQLTEGIESDYARTQVMQVLNRQREMLLTEGANVGASSFASGWVVMSFPILVDIYSEPIISEVCNVYPIDKPMISIPRIRIKALTRSYDGSSVEETYIPTATKLIRAGAVTVNATPNVNTNVFASSGLDPEKLKMNRRYTLLTGLHITETDASSSAHEYDLTVNFRPDNRNQIMQEVTFADSTGAVVSGQVHGNVNYDKGIITFGVVFSGGDAGASFEADYASFSLQFTPVETMNGRTSVEIETEQIDVTIDPNEDFLIKLSEEDIQDYQSIFKIDLLRTLSEAIKRQILLNKDYDLAYFLKAAETDMDKNGAKQSLDLDTFTNQGNTGDYTPATVTDVLRAIVPRISTLISIIRKNYNMYPSYMIAGLRTASLLRSLQDMMTNIPTLKGEIGFSGASAQFMKLKVLESVAIDEDRIYLTTKAPQNSLEKSSIIDLIFQPLYIVKEITNGNTRHFVRSRTMIEVVRTDGMGFIEVKNLEKYVG